MIGRKYQYRAAFVAAVQQSFLSRRVKAAIIRVAELGVDGGVRKEFNDRLIEALSRREAMQKHSIRKFDEELDRFTAEYEAEKTRMDAEFRETLARAGSEEEKERLWAEYRRRIHALQARVVEDVRRQSTTVLHDVAVLVSEEEGQ
jgi:hypothetical protein